jgi:DivIVA domain-containing protein
VTLLQILVVLAVVAAVAAVAAGVLRGGASDEIGLPEATTSVPALRLPPDRLSERDLESLRFSIGFRGYRMDEVDQVLDRLAGELRARDVEVAELRERLEGHQPSEASESDAAPDDGEIVEVAPHLGGVTQDVEES